MKPLVLFLKKDIVLSIASILALLSMAAVPPDTQYAEYLDFSVLAILFCLMGVVAGFQRCGLFDALAARVLAVSNRAKVLAFIFVLCCFFSAMLITNDVALLTFVPLTLLLFRMLGTKKLVFVVVMETLAANLGSALTPIGNPQNLYLYSYYKMDAASFFSAVLPLCLAGLALIIAAMLCFPDEALTAVYAEKTPTPNKGRLLVFLALFCLCVLTVLHFVPVGVCFFCTLLLIFFTDKGVFQKIDYALLATFAAFFVLVGNLGRMDAVVEAVSAFVQGRELAAGVLLSQCISNVPAALMLSHFTQNAKSLLLGVNLGGLGTLVASLASLISYKLYAKSENACTGEFFKQFALLNFGALGILYALLSFVQIILT